MEENTAKEMIIIFAQEEYSLEGKAYKSRSNNYT